MTVIYFINSWVLEFSTHIFNYKINKRLFWLGPSRGNFFISWPNKEDKKYNLDSFLHYTIFLFKLAHFIVFWLFPDLFQLYFNYNILSPSTKFWIISWYIKFANANQLGNELKMFEFIDDLCWGFFHFMTEPKM